LGTGSGGQKRKTHLSESADAWVLVGSIGELSCQEQGANEAIAFKTNTNQRSSMELSDNNNSQGA
jgi:hypothetical protein